MKREVFIPTGSNLLCTRADKREQRQGELVVPVRDSSGATRMVRKGEMPRVLELIVVAVGDGSGLDDQGRSRLAAFHTGDRIAVANSPVSIVYLNGHEHIIVDAQFVEGRIGTEDINVSRGSDEGPNLTLINNPTDRKAD